MKEIIELLTSSNEPATFEPQALKTCWDATAEASKILEPQLYYASGTFTVTSYGDFEINKSENGEVTVTGCVKHVWWDPYDWHAGCKTLIPGVGPGIGLVSDDEAICLENAGLAKSFLMESRWMQKLIYNSSEGTFEWRSADESECNEVSTDGDCGYNHYINGDAEQQVCR